MSALEPRTSAWNVTRHTCLAKEVKLAKTHWSRLRGLIGMNPADFIPGQGLWLIPSRGIHTFAMRFPIDVIYLNAAQEVVHVEYALAPWRLAPVKMETTTVLELPANTVQPTATVIGDRIAFHLEYNNEGR
jgi:uncharacterized membrane protein (UPF0127 family)